MFRPTLLALAATTALLTAAPALAADPAAPSAPLSTFQNFEPVPPPSKIIDTTPQSVAFESLQTQKGILTALQAINATLAGMAASPNPSKQSDAAIETQFPKVMRSVTDTVDPNAVRWSATQFAQWIAKANADEKKAFNDAMNTFDGGSRIGLVTAANIIARHRSDANLEDWQQERRVLAYACRWPLYDAANFAAKYPPTKGVDISNIDVVVAACKAARMIQVD